MPPLKDILKYTHQKRQALNSRYSRNAFARDLGVSPTALSQFLSGKRSLSPTNIRHVVGALCLSPDYVGKIASENSETTLGTQIKIDTFFLIAEWHHFAILNLVEIENIKSASQITRRLGITNETAALAVNRLMKLGFLKKDRGIFQRTLISLDTGTDIPSEALRKHNREKLELAIQSLEKTPLSARDVSSLTLTFDLQKMSEIKNEIKRFKKRIINLCRPTQATEVYSLNVQFFPLTQKEF